MSWGSELPAIAEPGTGSVPAAPGAVLGIGIAVLDLIHEVATYPAEDDEVRALGLRRVRGGNVTNSLAVLAQLGHPCRWIGTLGDDAAADLILGDLGGLGICTTDVVRIPGGATPLSAILLSRATGSRTIVHSRDLRELSAADFDRIPLEGLAWAHFEGRNPAETRCMIRRVRAQAPRVPISVELEKPRPGIEALLEGPAVVLASRAFARAGGFDDAGAFLGDLLARSDAQIAVVAWGAEGAVVQTRGGAVHRVPAYAPRAVVDTLGAGDVLNAGVIHGLIRGAGPLEAVEWAVKLAGLKCGQVGLRVPPELRT